MGSMGKLVVEELTKKFLNLKTNINFIKKFVLMKSEYNG